MEAFVKKTFYLAAAAALLMASSVAHAGGFSFEIDGQRIHIDAPRHCNSLSCISVTNNGSPINLRKLNLKGKKSDDDDDVASNSPATVKQPAPAAQAQAPVANNASPAAPAPPAPPAPATTYAPPAPAPAAMADASREHLSGLPSTATRTPPPAASANPAPVANAAPASQPAVANPPPTQQAASAANNPPPPPADAAAAPDTPIGLWQTADNKGNVRIEPCGGNLCGYAEKTNERILINMKPSGAKWSGRIHDPDSGSNYDSTIAMKGPNLLKVKGCAFGGLFCGGQTWKRIS
jgi:uncharacterized protein (DUF2147 family)